MSELIDREAVREFIKSYRHSTDVAFDMEKHLDEIPAAPRWHRAEDELPESGEMVMIYDGDIGFGCHEKGVWEWVDTFESGPAKVTHWMPLPEPPKEDA